MPTESARVGRPTTALGIWPDMIAAAGGVGRLSNALSISPQALGSVMVGLGSLSGGRAALAREFANQHGLTLRCYVHPAIRNAYLVSVPSGWLLVKNEKGAWEHRARCMRRPGEDWLSLPQLEVNFAQVWDRIN